MKSERRSPAERERVNAVHQTRRAVLAAAILFAAACAHAPRAAGDFLAEGVASYYGASFRGRRTASGEPFDPDALTAAHRTLPFGTCLRVESARTGRSVEVRVNDRGPFVEGRILDLSERAAREIGLAAQGVAHVRLYRCSAR